MKKLLTVSAAIELGAGLGLLCCPSAIAGLLFGATLETPTALTVARVGGAGLLALGVACWRARGDTQNRAASGLVSAMLLYNVAVVVVLAFAGIRLELHGLALWPAVILHMAMTIWCTASLRSLVRSI
jgi:hypothetical protein